MQSLYLAQSYTHKLKTIREYCFATACQVSADLYLAGYDVRSPIAHCHPIAKYMNNHNDSRFWVDITLNWLKDCDIMVVLIIPGFLDSAGIRAEYHTAVQQNKPVYLLNPLYQSKGRIQDGFIRTTQAESFRDAVRGSLGVISGVYNQEGIRPSESDDNPKIFQDHEINWYE